MYAKHQEEKLPDFQGKCTSSLRLSKKARHKRHRQDSYWQYKYATKECHDYPKGKCNYGDAC
eukprot:16100017-Heterocapsa_arctica.AAC.1